MSLHAVTRVRHALKRRSLTVASVEALTPRMVRIIVTGDDLADFVSLGFDDHVKLFFPQVDDPAERPTMREFTPRAYDTAARTLALDFALHATGPATEWAERAKAGDILHVGGPRGSMIIPDDFDWYLLAGDESALPAIGRRLEELSADARAVVIATVAGPEDQIDFASKAMVAIDWVHRPLDQADDPTPMLAALAAAELPPGDGHVWIAGENAVVKAARRYLVEDRGLDADWMKAAAYWRRGEADAHETIA